MNNSHFVMMNEDNTPFAVIRKRGIDEMLSAMKIAIEEEMDGDVIDMTAISFNDSWGIGETYSVKMDMDGDEETYRFDIYPTWEY